MSRQSKTDFNALSSRDSEALLDLLLRRIQGEVLLKIHERIRGIEACLASASPLAFANDCEAKLFRQRIVGSATLNMSQLCVERGQGSSALDNWINANRLVTEFIQTSQKMSLAGIQKVHQQISGSEHRSQWRKSPAEITGAACPCSEDLVQLMNSMIQWLETFQDRHHPIFLSAKIYEWIISTHPFDDANGRTARLVLDWHLGLYGYPPVSFNNQKETFVLLHPSFEENYPAEHSVMVVLQGIENTLAILFGPALT